MTAINPHTIHTVPVDPPNVTFRPAEIGLMERGGAMHLVVKTSEATTVYALGPDYCPN